MSARCVGWYIVNLQESAVCTLRESAAELEKNAVRVVIDARLRDGEPGGVQQIVIGLASGLSRLGNGGEEYLFATWRGHAEWLRPFVGGPCRIVDIGASRIRTVGRWVRGALGTTGAFGVLPSSRVSVAPNDRAIEALGADVIHFPTQRAFLTATPNVYQPHDLQHVHLPRFFSDAARQSRDRVYRTYCAQAAAVVVMSEWGRTDIVREYGLQRSRVYVVPWAPMLAEYPVPTAADIEATRRRYSLPGPFAYFPAHTFPHKNHVGLLQALARLRDSAGLAVPLVCTGRRNEFYGVIRERVRELRLDEQVRFLGFVPPADVAVLYRACRAVVFPTLFEGWGLPLSEAFYAGVPIACSRVTCLPEQADGGAMLFDPSDQSDMARAIAAVWSDEDLRARLVARGREVVARLGWDRTARMFRAIYRRVSGASLSPEDADLLQAAPVC
jgi:glycosyltransferase involved in cell wall biosynthesis